jgi:hypothetical protein
VVAEPCHNVRLFGLLPPVRRQVDVVVSADEQIKPAPVGRVRVEDPLALAEEDAQTGQLALR